MKNFLFFYESVILGDPNAIRFETGAKELARYTMDCERLTYPYTPLTWLMVDFIKGYYLKDPEGFHSNDRSFWERATKSPMFQYEVRINRAEPDSGQFYCRRVVEIFIDLKNRGFNLAKPIPVAENPQGHIVPLKGAKRIAGLLSLGIKRVPVLEYDRLSLSNMTEEQESTTCIDHARIIFDKLRDLPAVQEIRFQYPSNNENPRKSPFEEAIQRLIGTQNRDRSYDYLIERPDSLSNIPSFNTTINDRCQSAFCIHENWDILLWLYRRGLCKNFILVDHSTAEKLSPLAKSSGIELLFDASGKIDIRNAGFSEIILPSTLPLGFRIDGLETVENIHVIDLSPTSSKHEQTV